MEINFHADSNPETLRLSVTRTWGNRTLKTTSAAWKTLRKKVLERDNHSCKFCGFSSTKYMVCDHTNGDASNNSLSNLRILCPLCDLIRHCGLAGIYEQLKLYKSTMPQVDIVKQTMAFYRLKGFMPKPEEIDPKAVFVSENTVDFANILLQIDYDQLSEEQKRYKGFFTEKAKIHFDHLLEGK